jgi:hypothetical protein
VKRPARLFDARFFRKRGFPGRGSGDRRRRDHAPEVCSVGLSSHHTGSMADSVGVRLLYTGCTCRGWSACSQARHGRRIPSTQDRISRSLCQPRATEQRLVSRCVESFCVFSSRRRRPSAARVESRDAVARQVSGTGTFSTDSYRKRSSAYPAGMRRTGGGCGGLSGIGWSGDGRSFPNGGTVQ